MADNKWIHIENWMGKVLGLRANDLICFALIYSFSRDGESQFKGTLNYLAQCMFATEPTAISTLKKLLEVNLINKEDVVVNGKNRCYYSTNIIYDEGELFVIDSTKEPLVMTTKEPLVVTTKESLVNNNSTINSPLIKDNNKRESISKSRFQKPKIEEIESYIKEKKMHFDASQFYDHYESNGWMVGRTHMKDWKAACRTWERKRMDKSQEEEEKEELPEGLDRQVWEKCREWFISRTPRISGYITPDVYLKIKGLAKDSQEMAKIILYIERSDYSGDMVKEFMRLSKTGEYNGTT